MPGNNLKLCPWDSGRLSHDYEKNKYNEQVTTPSNFCVDVDGLAKMFCHYSLLCLGNGLKIWPCWYTQSFPEGVRNREYIIDL